MKISNKKQQSQQSQQQQQQYPFVSICTPTFNRRPFFYMTIQCFLHQTYPRDRMEWIIVDDGTDKVGDLFQTIPEIKYFSLETKISLGKKRNFMHQQAKGDILIYMDDDDYYPPERVIHAVTMLQQNPSYLIAGCSEIYIYFKHISQMYQFGPYGKYHSTAATFAFRKELLQQTSYQEDAEMAEEKYFLKNYEIPLLQLEPIKTILVFSHIHNSLDKKKLLEGSPNPFCKLSTKSVEDFVKEPEVYTFFMKDIDDLLNAYEHGKPQYKPEILYQIKLLEEKRKLMIFHQQEKNKLELIIQQLTKEKQELQMKNDHLQKKLKVIVQQRIEEMKKKRENVNE